MPRCGQRLSKNEIDRLEALLKMCNDDGVRRMIEDRIEQKKKELDEEVKATLPPKDS